MAEKIKIQTGDPTENGTYVAYIRHEFVAKYSDKLLLMWINGKWGHRMSDQWYRGEVLGWVGPLPAATISQLGAICVKYAISVLPDGLHGAFIDGPFDSVKEALEVYGREGQYIFELHLNQEAELIGKWSEKKQKWLKKRKK